jgi:HD-GYP domain-containing protein (c-di-GMP phosphodiesterase class II)
MPRPPEISRARQRLIEQALRRQRLPLRGRERAGHLAFALGFLVAAIAFAALAPAERELDIGLAVAFVLAYAVLASAEFSSGAGYFMPTQVIVVPMLLLLPTPLVPLLVAAGYALKLGSRAVRGGLAPRRIVFALVDAWFVLAPAVVLVALDAQTPEWSDWPAYLLALLAQFAFDAVLSSTRARVTLGLSPRVLLDELRTTYLVDLLLAPVGLLVAFAAAERPYAALLVLPLAGLFLGAAAEREDRVARMLELGRAYRGTALLLHQVVEEDDAYTGRHTKDVVELSGRVADELHLDDHERQITELGALLHDVGKIAVPKAILHKPAALDEQEWAVMRRHTVEGQRMLQRVGGLLSAVGDVVRASHERWDGSGYPDGLKGPDIPLPARIVTVCDAYNAMTTDRPYRRALPDEVALEELRRQAGRQFDPVVSDALLRIVRPRPRPERLAPAEA